MPRRNLKIVDRRTVTTKVYRRVRTETPRPNGGEPYVSISSVRDGTLTGRVEIYVDWDFIIETLGAKALNSRSGKATSYSGAIVFKVDRSTLKREGAAGSFCDGDVVAS